MPRGRRGAVGAVRRGIFGGSFDPVHLGHLTVAAAAADRLSLDRVHFVPARQQPFKTGTHAASAADRAAMLEAALAGDAGDPRFVLDRREIEREGVSYTVDTLRAMSAEFPDDQLFLLVGADAARELPAWRDADTVARLTRVIGLTRPGETLPTHPLLAETLAVPAVEVSGTEIRRRVRCGESLRGLAPPAVAQYIAAHGLYRAGD